MSDNITRPDHVEVLLQITNLRAQAILNMLIVDDIKKPARFRRLAEKQMNEALDTARELELLYWGDRP